MNVLTKQLKVHFDLAWEMLLQLIEICPDNLWKKKLGGFVFWQQILHVLSGIKFWTRQENTYFEEPFADREVYPEMDREPKGTVSKAEMLELVSELTAQVNLFFSNNDLWLGENNVIYEKILNIDVIQMQTRHLQYHVGFCDGCLRERKKPATEWHDYFGE